MDFLPLLHLLLSIITCFASFGQPLCHNDDSVALLEFKNSFNLDKFASTNHFAYPKVSSWRVEENRDCCSWDGVECNTDTGRVVALDLTSSFLHGSINSTSSLFKLSNFKGLTLLIMISTSLISLLKWVIFQGFSGKIPSSIENLHFLHQLDFGACRLSGLVPSSLGKLTKLTSLELSGNNFEGNQFPSFLQNLTQLTKLWLKECQLIGKIPAWLGNLTQLTDVGLHVNNMHGHIPSSLGKLTRLTNLNLVENNFEGQIPSFLQNLTQLTVLWLGDNQFNREIPSWFETFTHLTQLNLGMNKFHGLIPSSLGRLTSLIELDLQQNKFVGQIPSFLRNLTNLIYLSLQDNELSGSLYFDMFCGLKNPSSLKLLDFSNNHLTGMLPQCFENLNNSPLMFLKMSNNRFHGNIPHICAHGSNLRMIDLSHNQFQGPLPHMLANCLMLEVLNLGNNRFDDVFPSWLGTLPNLRLLILRSNNLHGVIRKHSNYGSSSLHVFDLSNNSLTGKLPSEFFKNLKAMRFRDAANSSYLVANLDYFSEAISWNRDIAFSITITNKGRVMQYEKIQEIFVVIDLSSNRFEGSIPESLGILQGLHVAHNHLTGPIPQLNQLNTFDVSSYEGNIGLCGIPLPKKCGSSIPPSRFEDEQDLGSALVFEWITILPGYVSGLVIGVVIGQIYATKKHDWWLTSFVKKNVDYDLLNKLKFKLSSLDKVLDDAEKKQLSDPAVRKWLNELKYTYYNTEDLVYEINTEALRCEINGKPPHLFSFLSTRSYAKSNAKQINQRIAKILGTLESIVQEKDQIGLNAGVENKSSPRPIIAPSLEDESNIYGRDADKEAIFKLLLSDNKDSDTCNKISVIPIVGMGGLGKTTLARLAYNDVQVNNLFDIKVWIIVSDEFDVLDLTKRIPKEINPPTSSIDIEELYSFQLELKKVLKDKKFLLVLDDVWNRNYDRWNALRTSL
ncbi:receptor-like protein 43 [Ziziphus jujuba]|uniref:Receptor-like protein 43 n=1 Tax=Ziziphus jujuba TaxID=326968 RepID=A0ABM4A7N9_ZIZJJ|nr:receptor-like protein 43 [Ziziphus jujuba]